MSTRRIRNRRARQVAALRRTLQRQGLELRARHLPWRDGLAVTRTAQGAFLMIDSRLSPGRQVALLERLVPCVGRAGAEFVCVKLDGSVYGVSGGSPVRFAAGGEG